MSGRKIYLLVWLTIQWLLVGPIAAALSYFLFFSDTHGLPGNYYGFSIAIFGLATLGYAIALRMLLTWRERS